MLNTNCESPNACQCHPEPLDCHSERSEESQGKLRKDLKEIGLKRDSSLRSE